MSHRTGGSPPIYVILLLAILNATGCRDSASRGAPGRDSEMVTQSRHNTCGPAALAMLLTALGHRATEAELQRRMALQPDGVTLTTILNTAAAFGVRLEAWRMRADTLGAIRRPAILWIDGDHFVVFDSLSSAGAHLRDPSAGRVIVPLDHLRRRWDGTAAVPAGPP